MMAERALRVSHLVVRVIATITIANLGMAVISDRYYPTYSHGFANSPLGTTVMFLTMAMSLVLPLYVGLEGWWMRKMKVGSKALWVDAVLAIVCLLLFLGVALYGLTHYAMF